VIERRVFAAPPTDVRKGFAFPKTPSLVRRLRLRLKSGRHSLLLFNKEHDGKAEPFRTSGGRAANIKSER
jgi:hypothetical protein